MDIVKKLENRGFDTTNIINAIYVLFRANLPTNDEQLLVNELNNGESSNSGSKKECNICMNAEVNSVILPCRHATMCYDCATQVKNLNGTCPFCNSAIEDTLQLYM